MQSSQTGLSKFGMFKAFYSLVLGDFGSFEDAMGKSSTSTIFVWVLFLLSTMFLMIAMLNLLISVIGNTFGDVISNENCYRMYELVQLISQIDVMMKADDREKFKHLENAVIFAVKPEIIEDEEKSFMNDKIVEILNKVRKFI